ncbi:MAG: D-glycero-beta-D-manno-heptose 1,7-bisphosphate 7-phosphatase [Magnetococcales bacterium]|nr:D-glycero-beta-D-manno-heptose 1,7-bisphosphate 7-phosphatase [Magnetococcales bacterium]
MNRENKVIILDRDGVLNQDRPDYVLTPEQLQLIDGVPEAIARLTQAQYRVLVATNQACIGKGLLLPDTLTRIHQKMCDEIALAGGKIDAIYHCPHQNEDHCLCRKPQPGLLLQAQKQWSFVPQQTWFVGDTVRDLQAARGANCLGALVLTGHGRQVVKQVEDRPHFKDLAAFVSFLLS